MVAKLSITLHPLYRKISAETIFDGLNYLSDETVLILDDSGKIADIIARMDAGDNIEHINGLLMPGHVNAHVHLELSHMKGAIQQRSGMVDFLSSVMMKREEEQEKIQDAIIRAEQQMMDAGIVAAGDICNTTHTIEQKRKKKLTYHHFIEVSGWLPEVAKSRLDRAKEIATQFKDVGGGLSLVPHAPYSVSELLLKELSEIDQTIIFTIHNQESTAEVEFFKQRTGAFLDFYKRWNFSFGHLSEYQTNSLGYALKYLPANRSLILVHNVASQANDIELAQKHFSQHPDHLFFALCPKANQYINGVLPDVRMMHSMDCAFVLGTDSLASNDELSIWSEINVLADHFPEIPLSVWLKAASSTGAKALNIENQFGRFEKGMKPGIFTATKERNLLDRINIERQIHQGIK
jgi:cytosine/adenosine deaminase-related metal-dependent hydrolase